MKKYLTLGRIKANYAIGARYRILLHKLIKLMIDDILVDIKDSYATHENSITNIIGDEDAAGILSRLIDRKFMKWSKIFGQKAPRFADNFVRDIDNNVKIQCKEALKKAPEPLYKELTVNFSKQSKAALLQKDALVRDNVNLITNIPEEMQKNIHRIVMEGMSRGRDLSYVQKELQKTTSFSERRIKLVARDQLTKTTGVVAAQRQSNLGIKFNKWRHSHGDKVPRQSHLAADGKIYPINEGCLIDGEKILPGEKINCTCFSEIVMEFEL
jgi:hypothetical protein